MEKKKSLKAKPKPRKVPREAQAVQKHFRLVVAYQGTHYQGWQKQAVSNGPATIQEMLEKAARAVIRQKKVVIHGSGRTDSGVHARGQVAHLRAEVDFPAEVLLKAMNAHLPDDIRILKLEECAEDFHSQLDVTAKTYRYFILNTKGKTSVHWPFLRPFTWFVTYPLDLEAMRAALKLLEGEHDFKSFQNRGTPVEDTVREILEARLIVHDANETAPPWMPSPELNSQLLEIRVRGTGFLKQMVRTIVGTVVEVGRGKLAAGELEHILKEKNRSASGMTAPANGLFLDNVEY
jgi:tRNA pseudouridine38-40 synthase